MCACIWSCPSQNVFGFPAGFVLSFFCDNHLLEVPKTLLQIFISFYCILICDTSEELISLANIMPIRPMELCMHSVV